jgi:hypothetical protein
MTVCSICVPEGAERQAVTLTFMAAAIIRLIALTGAPGEHT